MQLIKKIPLIPLCVFPIPSNLKINNKEDEIREYQKAVEWAKTFQEILQHEQILQAC